MPKAYSYAMPYHDGQTQWLPWKICNGYTGAVTCTSQQPLHTAADQKFGSLIAQDSPASL